MTFVQILNVSVSASWLVLAIVLFRLAVKRAPKALVCALWALVAVRLLCPVLPESPVSLIPAAQIIPEEYLAMEPVDSSGTQASLDIVTNPVYPESVGLILDMDVDRLQWQDLFWTLVWWAGMGVMTLYALYSYISLRLKTRVAVNIRENIWLCDEIDSPFILGMIRPRICLPSDMGEAQMPHVIAHEQAHLHRRDHWWKPLGFALLTVHWFNPVMWLAYWLLCRDIELACDEAVIRNMDRTGVCAYSEALIAWGTKPRFTAACPLAFGEVGVMERVKSMIAYRKPGFWMIVIAALLSVVLVVCFLTNPAGVTIGTLREPQFAGFFDGADQIWFSRGDQVSVTDQAEAVADRLNAVELSPNPISRDVSEDRDSTFQIRTEQEGNASLRISEDCTQIWADDGVKPSYSYSVKDPQTLRAILAEFLPGVDMNVLPLLGPWVSYQCIYTNPLSSYYSFGGDSGAVYHFDTNSFTIDYRNGSAVIFDPVNWDWQRVDWSKEPFCRLTDSIVLPGDPDLKTMLSDEAVYITFGEAQELILINDQGRVLLVNIMELNKIGWSVWSIYSLVPEDMMGKATWEFVPMVSAGYPGFRFEFDMEYTSVIASVSGGTLISFDEQLADGCPSGNNLEFPAGAALYWGPVDQGGNVVRDGVVRFSVMNGEETVAVGTLYIAGTEDTITYHDDGTFKEYAPAVYTARLVGTGLRLGQNAGRSGGLIDDTWIYLGISVVDE